MRIRKQKKDFSVDAILGQVLTPFRQEMIQRADQVRRQQEMEQQFRAQLPEGQKMPDFPPAFTIDDFNDFIGRLKMLLPDPAFLRDEAENVRTALLTGMAAQPPQLGRAETQLLWGAALLLMQANLGAFTPQPDPAAPDAPPPEPFASVTELPVWDQITDSEIGHGELLHHAMHAAEGLRRTDTRLGWTGPGSGFGFDAENNEISADLILSLMAGFEPVRARMINEIGRSQLAAGLPARQREVGERMLVLKDKEENGGGLDEAEYKELRLLAVEWELRRKLTDAAEDNAANRYAARKSENLAQNYAYALNHTLTTLTPSGLTAQDWLDREKLGVPHPPAPDAPPDSFAAFMNVVEAVRLSFYKNNRLFAHGAPGWDKMGVQPGWITREAEAPAPETAAPANGAAPPAPAFPPADFAALLELCGGAQGLENLQPSRRDRWYGQDYYSTLIEQYGAQRNAVIDTIWAQYLDRHFKALMLQVEQQIDKEMEEAKQNPQQGQGQKGPKQKGPKQKGQKGQGQGQGGGEGEPGDDDEEQEQEDGQEEDEPQDGDEQEQDGEEGQEQEGDGQDQDGQEKEGQDGKDGQKQGKPGKQGKPKDGKGKEGQGKEGKAGELSKAGVNKEGRKTDVKGKDGKSRLPDVDVPKEMKKGKKDEPGQDNDKNQNGKPGQPGQKGQPGKKGDKDAEKKRMQKSLKELFEEAQKRGQDKAQNGKDQKKGKQKGQGQSQSQGEGDGDGEGEGQGGNSGKAVDNASGGEGAGKGGQGKTLEEIGKGDWSDYPEIVAQLMGPIMQVQRVLKKVQEHQVKNELKQSRRLEMMPQDNDLGRLEMDAHRDLIIKQKTGQQLDAGDRNRFRRDEDHKTPVELDIVLLIDGSGSMDSGKGGPNLTPLESALLTATILYEAARRLDANVYIAMWGSAKPVMLAKPGDNVKEIAEHIVAARKGLSSGTSLAPAIKDITAQIAKHKGKQAYTGYTHMFVLSDGDIDDKDEAHKVIDTLLASPYVTLDFAIIKSNDYPSAMERLAAEVQSTNPMQEIRVVADKNAVTLPPHVVGLLLDKIQHSKSFNAIPAEKKRKTFQRAKRGMDLQ